MGKRGARDAASGRALLRALHCVIHSAFERVDAGSRQENASTRKPAEADGHLTFSCRGGLVRTL